MGIARARNGEVKIRLRDRRGAIGATPSAGDGLGVQMLYWPDDFCAAPADAGFAVTRFDNRDTGLSTRFSTAGVGPSYRQPDQRRLSGRW